MSINLREIKILELDVLFEAARCPSVREVARRLDLSPAALSKIIRRLENKLDAKLFARSTSGIKLTVEGRQALQLASEVRAVLNQWSSPTTSRSQRKVLTLGSLSFLCTYGIAPKLHLLQNSYRYRIVEFSHNDLVAAGLNDAFEVAIHIGSLAWTPQWESRSLGKIQWGLFARKDHPLSEKASEANVLKYPFIVPTDWSEGVYRSGEDHCPVSVLSRIAGDEATTAETAAQLVSKSDQLTYLPEIVARSFPLVKVRVDEWPDTRQEIFLTVRTDRVTQKVFRSLTEILKFSEHVSSAQINPSIISNRANLSFRGVKEG